MESDEDAIMEDCENNLNQPQLKGFGKNIMNSECMNYFEAYRMSTDKVFKSESKKCSTLQNELVKFSRKTMRKDVIENEEEFEEIVTLLASTNFNVLLYGIGSKVLLMSHICDKLAKLCKIIVIDTYCNNENYIKQLQIEVNQALADECKKITLHKISYKKMIANSQHKILIKVNNIENLLTTFPEQLLELSKLAQMENVKFLASVANVNTFKLCNSAILSNFSFIFKYMSTFQLYTEQENAHLMLSKKSDGADKSLVHVLTSMGDNQKKAFAYIAYQLLNYPDLTSKDVIHDEETLSKEVINSTYKMLLDESIITEAKKGGPIKFNLPKSKLESLA